MTGDGKDQTRDRLALRSRISDLAQVPAWTEDLASRYAIPENVRFAMDICLEEVLSNIIRHGYAGAEDRSVVVNFSLPSNGIFEIVVNDDAPHFNPLESPNLPPVSPCEDGEIRIGGQGIRLLRQFADTLHYDSTPTGNQLRMGFSAPH
jgi:anti-sigma regulatory factor (Ser/Thr protein kinase)